jgi:hypothetical protein
VHEGWQRRLDRHYHRVPDGKTLTITGTGTNTNGQATNNITVYDKQ